MFITVWVLRGFVFCPSTLLYFSHANTQQGTAAEEQTGHHDQPVWGMTFFPLKMIACYLFTDFKIQLDFARLAYTLSVILITNHFGPSADINVYV